ncbi:O-antigen ligase family protein [Pelomicrobium sp.]|uniref:O-antigen ligase family protein n=1 Tax=Pelomicrobium sp. TaxID=2815319 RepID=UPI002FDC7B0B
MNQPRRESLDIRDTLLVASLALFPIFFLTVRGWVNGFLFFLFLLSLTYYRDYLPPWRATKLDVQSLSVITALASPFLAILISQALRGDFMAKPYDGPLRMLLAIPLFLLLREKKIDFVKLLQYACPISLLLAVGSTILFPFRSGERLATYFVDPITFGNYSLVLGFMSLFSIHLLERDSKFVVGLKFLGFLAGVYLSIGSQSRSGWLAAPVLLVIWLITRRELLRPRARLAVVGVAIASALLFYSALSPVHQRINDAIQNVETWATGKNPNTSVGYRLTMWRMALVLFLDQPLYGYGDEGYLHLLDTHPEIVSFATPEARLVMHTGPHNELLASMLRAGIFGLTSTLLVFFVPAFLFSKNLRSPLPSARGASLLGLCFVIGLFLSGFFGEQVLYLKFLASFYGMMIASLCATALTEENKKPTGATSSALNAGL